MAVATKTFLQRDLVLILAANLASGGDGLVQGPGAGDGSDRQSPSDESNVGDHRGGVRNAVLGRFGSHDSDVDQCKAAASSSSCVLSPVALLLER